MDQCSGKGEFDAWQKAELRRLQWHLTNARSKFYSVPNVPIAPALPGSNSEGDLSNPMDEYLQEMLGQRAGSGGWIDTPQWFERTGFASQTFSSSTEDSNPSLQACLAVAQRYFKKGFENALCYSMETMNRRQEIDTSKMKLKRSHSWPLPMKRTVQSSTCVCNATPRDSHDSAEGHQLASRSAHQNQT